MTYSTFTTGSEATIRLGQIIGSQLKGGEVIELKGDIGSGKTTLTQGIVAGLGFIGEVSSPSFTISRVYPLNDGLSLHHFDFYRLRGHDLAAEELNEVMQDPATIAVIEWPGQGKARLPAKRLRITLVPDIQENQRSVMLESLDGGGREVIQAMSYDNRS